MITDEIKEKYDSMSKTQKKIASYIVQYPTDVSYQSVKALSREVKVSEASIIRFCSFLGYEGFPELKKALQGEAKAKNSMQNRIQASYAAYGEKKEGVAKVFQDDINRIALTLENLNMEDFSKVCSEMILAKRIFIVAARSAASLGTFFSYYLNMALNKVCLITDNSGCSDAMADVGRGDMVVGITFQRYSTFTVSLFQYAAEHKAVTVAITDMELSPVVKNADYCFYAETAMPTYLDSFAAPLSLINAFLTEIGRMRNVELEHRVTELDEFYTRYHIFE
jgi:DNA-binding MurR/RpiR family transcriptional regulator